MLFLVSPARSIEKIKPDGQAVKLVNRLLKALSIEDYDQRVKAVLPLVHKSLKTSDGRGLDGNIERFSFKKAYQNVKFYRIPISIYEVHKGRPVTIGFRETAERGRKDKYFVNKKDGVAGRPAPITVFWPEKGGKPTIVGMGSL
jgi:hypothetical protein